jgi:hypothetical protein
LIRQSFDKCGITSSNVSDFHLVLRQMLVNSKIISEYVDGLSAEVDCSEFGTSFENEEGLIDDLHDPIDSTYPTSFQINQIKI